MKHLKGWGMLRVGAVLLGLAAIFIAYQSWNPFNTTEVNLDRGQVARVELKAHGTATVSDVEFVELLKAQGSTPVAVLSIDNEPPVRVACDADFRVSLDSEPVSLRIDCFPLSQSVLIKVPGKVPGSEGATVRHR